MQTSKKPVCLWLKLYEWCSLSCVFKKASANSHTLLEYYCSHTTNDFIKEFVCLRQIFTIVWKLMIKTLSVYTFVKSWSKWYHLFIYLHFFIYLNLFIYFIIIFHFISFHLISLFIYLFIYYSWFSTIPGAKECYPSPKCCYLRWGVFPGLCVVRFRLLISQI